MVRVLTVLFILFSLGTDAQTYPAIHSSRPRIQIDSSRIAWLRANISTGDCGATYSNLVSRYNASWITDPLLYQVGSDTTIWTWNWSDRWSGDQVRLSAFIYRMSLDTLQKKRVLFIIDHFVQMADTVNFSLMDWYTEEGILRSMSDAGDVLLDWCYDSIPVPKRQALAKAIYKVNREFMNKYIFSPAGTDYVGSHNDLNCVFTNQNAITLFNADGLSTLQNDTVLQWFDSLYNKWTLKFFPVYSYYRGADGGWNWSAAYAMWSLTDQFRLFDNMLFGTGKDFYTDLPWVRNSINQYWYFMQPDNHCINSGDGGMAMEGDNVIYRHAAIYGDPRSAWLAQYYAQPTMLTWTIPVFNKLLYFDFTAAPVSKPSLPLNWWAVKKGLSVSRTSWDSASAMVWHFNSWSKKNNHEHWDNNTIGIYKYAPLIIDAGDYDSYGSSHWYNYYTRTIAHNSICVFDSADHYTYGTLPISNDGGQKYSPTLLSYSDIFDPANQRGTWLKFAAGSSYCYTIADASLAYDTAKLDRFVRRVLFDKPDHVIVLDHLHLAHTSDRQRDVSLILHFTNQPAMSGSAVSLAVPGHIETFNGKDYTATAGRGNIAIRTLLPALSKTTRIGGAGYEYWVNDSNYAPSVTPDTIYQTPGKWRIEVRPNTITDSVLYLHTLKIGDSLTPSVAGGVGQKNNYSIGVDWDNTLYYFNAAGELLCDYHVMNNLPGARTVTVNGFDLWPLQMYDIKVNGAPVATATTDTNGTIAGSVSLPGGLCKVEIVKNVDEIQNIASPQQRAYKVLPNPSNGVIKIYSTMADRLELELSVFTLTGKLVFSRWVKADTWIGLDLHPGNYLLQLRNNNTNQVEKLTIVK